MTMLTPTQNQAEPNRTTQPTLALKTRSQQSAAAFHQLLLLKMIQQIKHTSPDGNKKHTRTHTLSLTYTQV